MNRLLNVEEFGEVAALLSLFIVVTVPAAALTMLMSREAASRSVERVGSVRDFFLHLRRHVFLGAIVAWMIFLGLVPLLSSLLHIPYEPFLIFSAIVPITLVSALQSGVLQGMQEFFMLSKQHIFTAVVKLSAAAALVSIGITVSGVMLALVLAVIAGWYYGYRATQSVLDISAKSRPSGGSELSVGMLFTSILLTTLLVALLSNVDVLLAKHFFSSELAGHYGALSTVGKILIYGVGAFVTVLLPLASAARAQGGGGERQVLGLSLAAIGACSAAAWALFSLFPELVISLLFGSRYLDVAPYLGTFMIAMGCIALSLALINYFVAVRNSSFIYLLTLGILVEFALISLRHESLSQFVEMFTLASLLLLLLLGLNYFLARRVRFLTV